MANRLVLGLLLVIALGTLGMLGACGRQIGDACNTSVECSPNGDRLCDPSTNSPGGYCTVFGCDYNTCPGNSACIRFFTSGFANRPCTASVNCTTGVCAVTDSCQVGQDGSLDEQCSLSGFCVSRSSEIRYCMKTCDSDGDCRGGYECRNGDLMKTHGGEPVPPPPVPGKPYTPLPDTPKFCAVRPGG